MDIPEIDASTAAARADVLLLDVREHDEWAAGHGPAAVHVPLGELASRIDEIPRDHLVVCICRSGNRSARATQFLRAQGIEARNMVGGMRAWALAGLPLVATGVGDEPTVI